MTVIAIFGPTGVGKTAVAIELASLLRARGERPVAVSCDAIQVYRGLEILSGAADERERERLEHRLVGIVGIDEEFSAGRFAQLARSATAGSNSRDCLSCSRNSFKVACSFSCSALIRNSSF